MHALLPYNEYMKVVPILFVFMLFFIALFAAAPRVWAGIAFPECGWDEITASCQCPHAYNVCADNSCSRCEQYKSDPHYRYLWKDIYCRKATLLELAAKYEYSFIIPFMATVVLQLIVFAVRGYRKTGELLRILPAICVTVFIGAYLMGPGSLLSIGVQRLGILSPFQNPAIHFSLYGMDLSRVLFLLLVSALMVVCEALLLIRLAKFEDREKVWKTALIAHFVSLFLGLGTLNAVYPHFLQPRIL